MEPTVSTLILDSTKITKNNIELVKIMWLKSNFDEIQSIADKIYMKYEFEYELNSNDFYKNLDKWIVDLIYSIEWVDNSKFKSY